MSQALPVGASARTHRSAVLLASPLLLAAGCLGPKLLVEKPEGHRIFVDGVETRQKELAFRYFGTVRWDTLPVDDGSGVPTFDVAPGSGTVRVEAPASGLLFPFDLGIELADRLLHGRRDVTIDPAPVPRPAASDEIQPAALGDLSARGRAARTVR